MVMEKGDVVSFDQFVEEYFSDKCFYWSETVEETNMILEVAEFLGIPTHSGDYYRAKETALSRLTIFQREDGTKYTQRQNLWHPEYGLKVRSEKCMYAEFHEYVISKI